MKNKRKFFAHPTAIVEEGADIGEGTKIWHFAHIRSGAKIGKGCNIGKDVYVDADVVIGNGVKIQNGVSVYKGVTIEDDAFIGPYAVFTNDLYPRSFVQEWKVVPTRVREGASIGANATIVCGVTIGRYAMIAAGAVVTKDVPDHGLVMGCPARLRGFVCYCGKPLKDKDIVSIGEEVIYKCGECGKEVRIKRSDYDKMVRERNIP